MKVKSCDVGTTPSSLRRSRRPRRPLDVCENEFQIDNILTYATGMSFADTVRYDEEKLQS